MMGTAIKPQSGDLKDYLKCTDIIDFNHPEIAKLAGRFKGNSASQTELIKAIYEYVRDEIHHSADIEGKDVTCRASDVLTAKEGICYAKSHLLAALLRLNGIPTGFCYQALRLNEEIDSPLALHGLIAVYLQDRQNGSD